MWETTLGTLNKTKSKKVNYFLVDEILRLMQYTHNMLFSYDIKTNFGIGTLKSNKTKYTMKKY